MYVLQSRKVITKLKNKMYNSVSGYVIGASSCKDYYLFISIMCDQCLNLQTQTKMRRRTYWKETTFRAQRETASGLVYE